MQFTAQNLTRSNTLTTMPSGERTVVRPNQEDGQTGPWTEGVVAAMRSICAEADQPSAATIAARLNEMFDFVGLAPVTRNAVIGKCHRMRLALNTQRPSAASATRTPREPKPQRERTIRVARQGGDSPIRLIATSLSTHDGDPRKKVLAISAQLDAHHQNIIDLFDAQDPYVDDETPFRSVAEIAASIAQPENTVSSWPDALPPIVLQDTKDCNCRYVTSRSKSGMHYFCGAERASVAIDGDKKSFISSFCPTHHAVSHQRGSN